MKELRPDLVATFQDASCSHEGHPLIVEAGVCIGGRDAKPGITVYRFANRIPLLFEGGADVATQVPANRPESRSPAPPRRRPTRPRRPAPPRGSP